MPNWSGLKKRLPTSTRERLLLVDPDHPVISLVRQSELLHIARSSIYYRPLVDPFDKSHMDAIDEIFTDHPFYGSRRIQVDLRIDYGIDIGRERVQHLMRSLGLVAIYPKPNLSRAAPMNEKYPYLLKGLAILRPNQVFGSDITYIRTAHGFVYLVAFIDWFSRYVVAWYVSASESGEQAKDLIADAVARHGVPPDQLTIHADRGSSMTSNQVAELLSFLGIKRSHSRPHVSNDNPYSEAQFKTLKYCPSFPERFGSIADARVFCESFFAYYCHEHRHSGIGYHTPASVHFGTATEVRGEVGRWLSD